jgi:DNA uptake protein ComE-like DNA-binding protein
MQNRTIIAALIAVILMLTTGLLCAEEIKDPFLHGKPQAMKEAEAAEKQANARAFSKTRKVATKKKRTVKQIDVNSASKAELKKVSGISDAYADKIISGRPYATKANLVVNKVVPEAVYLAIKDRIIARQPYKDGAKNAAIYSGIR